MDYFSKFLRTTTQPSPKAQVDHAQEFHNSWNSVKVSSHFIEMHILSETWSLKYNGSLSGHPAYAG